VRSFSTPVAAIATAVNFPIVLVGLLLIVLGTDGDDSIALLNLWAIWGLANTLLGQIGLLAGSTDGLSWTDRAVVGRSIVFGVVVSIGTALTRGTLFPSHERWWIAAGCLAAAAHTAGRQRGSMAARGDGATTVVFTAFENLVRMTLVGLVVLAGGGAIAFGDVAIVLPFAATLTLQHRRLRSRRVVVGPSGGGSPTSVWPGLLAGLPGVAAYAVIPGLTLLDVRADLDAYALASSLLRGPLLVGVFASAWLLDRMRSHAVSIAPLAVLPVVLVVAQLLVGAVLDLDLVPGLVVHGVAAGLALVSGYTCVLGSSVEIATDPFTPALVLVGGLVFVGVLVGSQASDIVHPFLALSALGAVIGIGTAARSGRNELSP
jgi:hypothetical protein